MRIDIIDDLETLQSLGPNWRRLHDADPEAHYFLAWDWVSPRLWRLHTQWLALAARPSPATSENVGVFPLQLRTAITENNRLVNDIAMAGNRIADYGGFLCALNFPSDAVPAFGNSSDARTSAQDFC